MDPASSSSGGLAVAAAQPPAKKTILKCIILGQAGTGKTSLLNRFVDNTYQPVYKATLGADTRDVEVTINDEKVVLQLWDTAGQERFNSLTQMFLKGSDMVLLVFDMTRADSFDQLSMWRDQFLSSTKGTVDPHTFPFALIANNWCSMNGNMAYTECSAKEGANVHQAFMDLARKAMKIIQAERAADQAVFAQPPPNIVLPTAAPVKGPNSKKSTSSCCA